MHVSSRVSKATLNFSGLLLCPRHGGFRTASVDDYETGYQLYLKGDYDAALSLWQPLADDAHVLAQFGIATLYYEGQGLAQDFIESARWFERSAERGYAPAQFNLGNSR